MSRDHSTSMLRLLQHVQHPLQAVSSKQQRSALLFAAIAMVIIQDRSSLQSSSLLTPGSILPFVQDCSSEKPQIISRPLDHLHLIHGIGYLGMSACLQMCSTSRAPDSLDLPASSKAANFQGNGPDNARVDVEVPRASFETRPSCSAGKSTQSDLRVTRPPPNRPYLPDNQSPVHNRAGSSFSRAHIWTRRSDMQNCLTVL